MNAADGSLVVFLISIFMIVLSGSALIWSIKSGFWKNVSKGATLIFDEEEPVGKPIDQLFK